MIHLRRILALLVALPCLVLGAQAYALQGAAKVNPAPEASAPEEATTEADVPETSGISISDVEMASVDFNESFGMFQNDFLSDIVKLSYQISLLEKMIDRQAELAKISESFGALGMNFREPPPPRGICAQLPANAACVKFYPELYPEIVNSRRAYYEELKAKAAAANPQIPANKGESEEERAARIAREEAARIAILEKAERKARYLWSDVTCTSGNCHGVLIASAAPGFRATVRPGERLNDGTLVEAVSKDGIRVRIKGDVINVRPAPSEESKDGAGTNPTAAAFEAAATGTGGTTILPPDTSAASVTTPATAVPAATATTAAAASATTATAGTASAVSAGDAHASGQTVAEPALGPSGLF